MRNSRSLFVLLAALTMSSLMGGASRIEAQEATLEIEVQGWGLIAGVGHDCASIRANGRIEGHAGFTETCQVWAVDADGALTKANIWVEVADTTRVRAVVVADTLDPGIRYVLTVEILRGGNSKIRLKAKPFLFLAMIHADRPPPFETIDTIPPFNIYGTEDPNNPGYLIESETSRLCAYEGGYSTATRMGLPADGFRCPTFGNDSIPTFPVRFRDGGAATLESERPLSLIVAAR